MKAKLVPFIALSILFINAVKAGETAKLQIHLSGAVKNNQYLCIDGEGCINIKVLGKKTVPMKVEDIHHIYLANLSNYRVYPQITAESCKINVKSDQLLTFSGTVHEKNGIPYIQDMHCSIVNKPSQHTLVA